MKTITFDNPDKMHFESAHKAFNKQTVLLTIGNAILPTQLSYYIRPTQKREYNERPYIRDLQDLDLLPFIECGLSPYLNEVRKIINERGTKAILYLFYHTSGEQVIQDGLLLTTGANDGYQELQRWYLNRHWKAQNAFEEAIHYVTNPKPE